MAKSFAKAFYKSKAWLKCRSSYIAYRISIDGGLCEHCKDNQGYIVHHVEMLTKDNINNPDISLNHSNLEYVCKVCHDKEEGHWLDKKKKNKPTKEEYKFSDKGELIPVLPP